MIDRDGIERPDNPHAHMRKNHIAPTDKEITEDYNFVNRNIFFRMFSGFFNMLVKSIMGPWIKKHYKLQIEGKENIKLVRRKGVIVTVNHVHNFDNMLVGTKLLRNRKCYFITLKDNINMPFVGFLLRSMGGIPIPTSVKAIPEFEKSISKLLAKKKAIIICPEASLWPYYRDIRPFKKGAFRFAVKDNVPVLPVVISFRRKLRKKAAKKGKEKYKYYFTVHVGKPVYHNTEIEPRRAVIELTNQVQTFYKDTIENFYVEEEKLEKEATLELINSNKKIARNLKPKLEEKEKLLAQKLKEQNEEKLVENK